MENFTNKPLISIIIPVYGVEKYIERCTRSLFEQTYDNIEYVFIDDCTPDKSIEILKRIGKSYKQRWSRVNVIRNISNLGLAEVRNIGVKHCHGDFLMHVDSDDWLDIDAVEKCVEEQLRSDADIVFFSRKIYRNTGVITHNVILPSNIENLTCQILKRQFGANIWGMLINSTIYKNNNITCIKGVNMSEDYQILPKIIYFARTCTVAKDTYYNYEMRNINSISAKFKEQNVRQEWETLDELSIFFKDKPDKYKEALHYGTAILLCYQRHNAALYKKYSLCSSIEKRMEKISQGIFDKLPLPYRIGLYIKPLYVLRLYVKCLKYIKNKRNR